MVLVPLGIRLNNPGNIIRTSELWHGELSYEQVTANAVAGLEPHEWSDRFCVFESPQMGVRAIGHILQSKALRGLHTVNTIIRDYSATDQDAYVRNVSQFLGVQPDEQIDVAERLPELAIAIIRQENGEVPYDPHDIAAWVFL